MKKAMLALFFAGCAQHITRARPGWQSCKAAGNAIRCGGTEMAQVECAAPEGETCGELAMLYAGGERVVLARNGALRPEMAPDASRIWFKDAAEKSAQWQVYDPQSGVMQVVDAFSILQLHERDAIPLWKGGSP